MTEEKIEKIIKEIISLDGSFLGRENELKNIVKELLASRPDVKINDNFIYNLRLKLLEKAEKTETPRVGFSDIRLYFRNLKRLALAGSALTLLIVVFTGVWLANNFKEQGQPDGGQVAITRLKERAFGELGLISGSGPEQASDNISEGKGLDSSKLPLTASSSVAGGGGNEISPGIIPEIPEIVNYKYVYQGGDFAAPEKEMEVFRRVEGVLPNAALGDILSKINLDFVDLHKFSRANLTNFTLIEDRDFGYIISIDLKYGSFSMYKNWERWPDGYCGGNGREMCTQSVSSQFLPSDVPSDEEIISIADDFLAEYGINKSSYGKGKVQDFRGRLYAVQDTPASESAKLTPEGLQTTSEQVSDQTMPGFYMPEPQVVYPLLINGKIVYDQSGNESGLIVGVDVRHKKVSSLYNLLVRNFESSLYETETDTAKIIKLAESGGMSGYYYGYPEATKTTEIILGTPSLELVIGWKYEENGNGHEFYMPAFIFPILKAPDASYFYQKNIVVPVVKEVIGSSFGKPVPMPFY